MWIDSHCHLSDPRLLEQLPNVKARMIEHQVNTALLIGTNIKDCETVLSIVNEHNNDADNNDLKLYASVGIHPEYKDESNPTVEQLLNLAQSPNVIAIGETGLDYHWFKEDSIAIDYKERLQWQHERFATHIQAANLCKKPLIIHTRDAGFDTIDIMKSERANQYGGIIHCFTETLEFATAALDLGFYISFSGIVTFKNAKALQEIASNIPLDRILVETDAPYLAPMPHRGKTNEPAFVRYVGEYIAQLRNIDTAEFAQITSNNFKRLFKL